MKLRARSRLALLLVVLLMTPAISFGQNVGLEVAPPTPLLPLPLGGPRYEDGGFFVAGQFLFMRQTNPIERQDVAFRGFIDFDGTVAGTPGALIGSGAPALRTDDVGGPGTWQPGLALTAGWRFRNGVVLEATWWHLTDTRYSATASLIPLGFNLGPNLADTFVSSPVVNFPIDYAGPSDELPAGVGSPTALFGIWNGAELQTIDFVQRFDQGMINFRIPVDEGENHRFYGIVGGRAVIMWERFKWRVVDADRNGTAAPDDVAIFSNVVSNRWYGANVGCGWDWYLGGSPLGAFAISCELHGSVGIDIVKERAKYERADFFTAASRARNEYTVSPLVQGDVSLWWYPTQAIQVRFGWQGLGVFNTVAATRPIDFNFGAIAPPWESGIHRFFHGLHAGIGFVF